MPNQTNEAKMAEFHLSEAGEFKNRLDTLCKAERTLRSNAAAPNPKLEVNFRAAALDLVAAYRAASKDPSNSGDSGAA